MTIRDVINLRLANQHLIGSHLKKPTDVVRWLGAVQAQDYVGAKWALAQRTQGYLDSDINRLYDEGKILRTHILRPTWHFVAPEDIRWMQSLTAPRVNGFCKYYYKKLELDTGTFKKGNEVLAKVLQGGKHLTGAELKEVYKSAGIDASGLRLTYLIMRGELDALICNGAMKGKQRTYALVDDRAPKTKSLSHDEALAALTLKYFTSHGPAQMQDFAWWSSLTTAEVKKGLELVKSKLLSETIDGKMFWFAKNAKTSDFTSPLIHLLPNYDEFLIAYKDHSPSLNPNLGAMDVGDINVVFGNHIIVLDGFVIGGWRRAISKTNVRISTKILVKLTAAQKTALRQAAEAYGTFLGLPVKLEMQ